MNNFLEIALDCIKRGWHTFPCAPRTKIPRIPKENGGNGYKDATTDEVQVRAWWERWPDSNVPIATGASGLCVLDIDSGIADEAELREWMMARGLPVTYAVRTGRRPDFGVQLYYAGIGLQSKGWEQDGCKGDIRCSTGLVMAAGSTHKSGERYTVLWDLPVAPVPDYIRTLTTPAQKWDSATDVDEATADSWKTWLLEYMARNEIEATGFEARSANGWRVGIVCPWHEQHSSGKGGDSSTVLCILDGRIAFKCSHGTCDANKHDTAAFKQLMTLLHNEAEPEPGEGPEVVIGTGTGLPMPNVEEAKDWRDHWHTYDEAASAPPVRFIIDHFMTQGSVTALASLPAQRKTIIALNVAHSCCTGEPLFGYFKVENPPTRVLYLCPEMGLSSLTKKVKEIGLLSHVGKSFFYRSANMDTLALEQLRAEELEGALVVIDTAVRYTEGNENDSGEMKKFSNGVMALMARGAVGVFVLFHSGKGAKETDDLNLQNSVRGSSEFGAFIAHCWATRLQDQKDVYNSESFLTLVKQREFESLGDFTCKTGGKDDPKLVMVSEPSRDGSVKLKSRFTGDTDNKGSAALEIIKAHVRETVTQLHKRLSLAGIERSEAWVQKKRAKLRQEGTDGVILGAA